MAGRRPKPTALKLLTGNPGKRKLNKDEPKALPGVPLKPEWLAPLASVEWDHISPMLLEMNVLTTADGAALANYCQSYARMVQAEAEIDRLGIIIEVPVLNRNKDIVGTNTRPNPACRIADACKKEMRAQLGAFGLDPSSRSRIKGAAQDKPASGLLALVKAQQERRQQERAKWLQTEDKHGK